MSLTLRVQWRNDQIAATVDREIVILSVERGSYCGLDEVGSEIWQQMENPVRVDALCEALATKYDAYHRTIERDVLALLEQLAAEELVSGPRRGRRPPERHPMRRSAPARLTAAQAVGVRWIS